MSRLFSFFFFSFFLSAVAHHPLFRTTKLLNYWEGVLIRKPRSFLLWRQYLKFRQSNNLSFEYQTCSLAFSRALAYFTSPSNQDSPEETEKRLLVLFEDACLFHLQCGYTEKAFACFQALIELNLFCPPFLQIRPIRERIAQLQLFWDSPAPRFGENVS